MLVMMCCTLFAMAEDRNAYVSNVVHEGNRTVVTVSAKPGALENYPDGFVVAVRPKSFWAKFYNKIRGRWDLTVKLTKDNPTGDVIFYCNSNDSDERKACKTQDFDVESKL